MGYDMNIGLYEKKPQKPIQNEKKIMDMIPVMTIDYMLHLLDIYQQ